jgi:hypothetical protein
MDPEGWKARITPGRGLSVPGRMRTRSVRIQGSTSPPTTMRTPAHVVFIRVRHPRERHPRRQLRCRTPKTYERSGNVYENKGSLCRTGTDVALERLRCAEGAGRSTFSACRDLSLRDIADPAFRGLRQPRNCVLLFSREQSQNVYENKGSDRISTAPDPSVSKEGNSGLPSSGEEGVGVVPRRTRLDCRLECRRHENCRNKARMSLKTKDRHVSQDSDR